MYDSFASDLGMAVGIGDGGVGVELDVEARKLPGYAKLCRRN